MTLDVSVYLSEKAYYNLGQEPLDIAYNYLDQALGDLSSSYSLTKGTDYFDASKDYNGDGTSGSDSCVDLEDFEEFLLGRYDSSGTANHVVTYGDWTCNPGSNGYSSWSSNAEDIAELSKDPETYHEDTTTGAQAITGVLHEVGHSLLVGEYNECDDYIDDPDDGDVIYLKHLWSNCFDNHTVG